MSIHAPPPPTTTHRGGRFLHTETKFEFSKSERIGNDGASVRVIMETVFYVQ